MSFINRLLDLRQLYCPIKKMSLDKTSCPLYNGQEKLVKDFFKTEYTIDKT